MFRTRLCASDPARPRDGVRAGDRSERGVACGDTGSIGCFVLAMIALILSCPAPAARAQESLSLQKVYDLGASRYSEGLDFHDGFLWHTTGEALYKLHLESATDTDDDGDHDLAAEKTWAFTHNGHSESSVWFNDQLFNFTFWDRWNNVSDAIFKLVLNDDETYLWQQVGVGLGTTNWGSCRDSRSPGESIVYTGHYDNRLMWYDPQSGNTIRTLVIPDLVWIEDLGMDRFGTVWASSFNGGYPGLYRIDPDTGELLGTYFGPAGLVKIDGIAIRPRGDHDVMYVTGKNTPFIWEYLVPSAATGVVGDDLAAASFALQPNYPNPFNPTTTVVFSLPRAVHVRLGVYSLDGKRVRTLLSEVRATGEHAVNWNGTDDDDRAVASGTYIYRLEADEHVESRRMVLVR